MKGRWLKLHDHLRFPNHTARVFEFKAPKEKETLRFGGASVPAPLRGERMGFDLKNSLYVKAVFKYGVKFNLK